MKSSESSSTFEAKSTHTDSPESEKFDPFSHAASQVREDIEKWVEGLDFQEVSKKVGELGRRNPVGLAVTALALGVAVGFLIRKKPQALKAEGERFGEGLSKNASPPPEEGSQEQGQKSMPRGSRPELTSISTH